MASNIEREKEREREREREREPCPRREFHCCTTKSSPRSLVFMLLAGDTLPFRSATRQQPGTSVWEMYHVLVKLKIHELLSNPN